MRTAAALLLGGWACAGGAQTLGTPAVDPLLGRPLDMAVPARFAPGEGNDECVHADVFYGETRVPARHVRASIGGPPDQRRIRIESALPVDEPVVVVSLRAGCRSTITRNYTLLPEYPGDTLIAAAEARALALASSAIPLKAAPAVVSTSPRRAGARTARASDREGSLAVAKAAAPAARSRPPGRTAPNLAVAGGPRLRLEPIDLPEEVHALRTSATLAQPQGDLARRATAALLWQAINADPQDLLRASVRLQRMEQELGQLRQAAGQTRGELVALRQRLDQAQPWYASSVLAQVLGVLVLALAAAAGMLWYRTRKVAASVGDWYLPRGAAPGAALAPQPPEEEPVQPAAAPVVVAPRAVAEPVPELPPLPVRVREMPQPLAVPPAAPQAHLVDFEVPQAVGEAPRPDGALRVETLAATFEEAEFLASLGLFPDAMDVLKAYLQDSAQPAPVAFYELMRLCDQAQDAVAVATVRRRHAQALRAEAPRLEQVMAATGLDGMPALAARIQRAWGTPGALDAIERELFEVPAAGMPLTLQAARDLLFLYDLALARVAQGAVGAEPHPVAPWADAEDAHAAGLAAQAVADAKGGDSFGLDLDLSSTPAAPSAFVPASALELELAPIDPPAPQQRAQEDDADADADAFSAAVASERAPASRY